MTPLARSHAELRAALRLAGIRIKGYNRGRDRKLLALLRRVLREARKLASEENSEGAARFR